MEAHRLYIGLLHYPVLDRDGRVITTAVTNMDLHDLARMARTYDLPACYVIQPLELQRRLVQKLCSYWLEGRGADYNVTRKEAFQRLRIVETLDQAVIEIERETGSRPATVITSAKKRPGAVSFSALRDEITKGGVWLLLFGTGWGIAPERLENGAQHTLEPVRGGAEYNHLSVRTAAAIIIDRLLGDGK